MKTKQFFYEKNSLVLNWFAYLEFIGWKILTWSTKYNTIFWSHLISYYGKNGLDTLYKITWVAFEITLKIKNDLSFWRKKLNELLQLFWNMTELKRLIGLPISLGQKKICFLFPFALNEFVFGHFLSTLFQRNEKNINYQVDTTIQIVIDKKSGLNEIIKLK